MLGPLLLAAARSPRARGIATGAPGARGVVERFVAGERLEDALAVTRRLLADGLVVSLDHLGEDVRDEAEARATASAYRALLEALAAGGLADRAEVSVKLSALGLPLGADGPALALAGAREVCAAAAAAGTTVTVDMEGSPTVAATLEVVRALRGDFPWVGAVVQSALRRTEDDCRDLAGAGSRVRLVKGAYAEPPDVAHQGRAAVDAAYLRCLRVLLGGDGYPMVATHDPALLDEARLLARETGRGPDSWEVQMLYGVRAAEQRRLARSGLAVRVYVPYGSDWWGYFLRRLAERPANVAFLARALVPGG